VKKPMTVATTPVPAPIPVDAPPSATPAPASGGASRDRFDAMARDYAQTATGSFTVQVVIVCEVSNLEKAIRDGGQKVWFVPVSVKGRSCYRVFWGNYRTREEAARGAGEIPARLRESKPAVVTIPKR
jgi:septal ring-binding cell division protein DamX